YFITTQINLIQDERRIESKMARQGEFTLRWSASSVPLSLFNVTAFTAPTALHDTTTATTVVDRSIDRSLHALGTVSVAGTLPRGAGGGGGGGG
ncbi:hypothetical protein ACJX0J_029877, partial [Zea mays]